MRRTRKLKAVTIIEDDIKDVNSDLVVLENRVEVLEGNDPPA